MREKTDTAEENADFGKALAGTLPLGRGVRIAAADARGIFALEKPAGTLTHPNAPGLAAAKNALFVADYSPKNECFSCRVAGGKIRKIFVLNRLDSPTSGLVLAATDAEIAAAARRAFVAGTVRKIYFALVCGNADVPAQGAAWKNFLRRERDRDGSLRVRECGGNARDALFAETRCGVVRAGTLALGGESNRGNANPIAGTLLRLEPKTGRTHQLRVQCALRKTPILGDGVYGDFRLNARFAAAFPALRGRLFLHAAETEIAFPWRGVTLKFSARSALPPEFDARERFL